MDIIWTHPAKNNLRRIFNYFKKKVSVSLAQKIISSIFDNTSLLCSQNIGTKEQLLSQLGQEHRFIIDGNYKIIYFTQDNIIYITHIFDTRQNPTKLFNKNKID